MNFKDAFDKDCSKINVSDELINKLADVLGKANVVVKYR